MAQHGYLREFDEGWNRDEDRNRESSWRDGDRNWNRDRDRSGFMFGDRDRGDQDRNAFERMGDRAREQFRDDDRQYRTSHRDDWSRREQVYGGYQSEFDRSPREHSALNSGSDWDRSPRGFRSGQDDHYRSWRDQQMRALDRDYEDYCREREQQFHSDFDSWRRNRSQSQQGQQGDSSEEVMELTNPKAEATEIDSGPSPVADATLGTNNSENTIAGRR